MRKEKIFLLFFLGIFLIGIVSAATYCCEKTTSGAWCQNVNDKAQCDSGFRNLPSFCQATSFCKIGTCINQKDGTCIDSAETICKNNGGLPSDKLKGELDQCKNGCCLMGDGASFKTKVACDKQSSDYGIGTTFNPNINDEQTCLASANPQAQGACIYTENYVKTCRMTIKKDCQDNAKNSALSGVEFHQDYLCSAPELDVCGPTDKTRCDDKGNVRFVDTCNQLANIYDSRYASSNSNKPADYQNYWTKILAPTCTSATNPGNKNSPNCGECDYYSSSMCKEKKAGDSVDYGGTYLCKSLDCVNYKGQYNGGVVTSSDPPRNGETWCVTDTKTGYENRLNITGSGDNLNPAGNTQFRLMCNDGEITKTECPPTRQNICSENYSVLSDGHKFYNSLCKVNSWSSCLTQSTQSDCEDIDARDCVWKTDNNGYSFDTKNGLQNTGASGICLPKYSPGFNRDAENKVDTNNDVVKSCGLASTKCYAIMVKIGISDKWVCKPSESEIKILGVVLRPEFKNDCSCVGGANENDGGAKWGAQMDKICTSLGDCGDKTNYVGTKGYTFNSVTIQTVSN